MQANREEVVSWHMVSKIFSCIPFIYPIPRFLFNCARGMTRTQLFLFLSVPQNFITKIQYYGFCQLDHLVNGHIFTVYFPTGKWTVFAQAANQQHYKCFCLTYAINSNLSVRTGEVVGQEFILHQQAKWNDKWDKINTLYYSIGFCLLLYISSIIYY